MAQQAKEATGGAMVKRTKNLVSTLESQKESFARALAGRFEEDQFIQIVATAFMNSDQLYRCAPTSIYKAAIESAQVGLKPDNEEAAIVPYWNNDEKALEAQFQPMYMGYVRLMLRAGARKVESRVVREGDYFEFRYGLSPDIDHRPASSGDRGEVTHAYAIIWLANGEKQFEVMDRDELNKIRSFAASKRKGKDSPAWSQWEDQMYRKCPLRRLRKWVELDANASAAIRKDELLDAGQLVQLQDISGEFQIDGLEDRARAHARRHTEDLRGRISEVGGEPATIQGEVVEDDDEPFDIDGTVPSGQYKGQTWGAVIDSDRSYVERIASRGEILSEAGLRGLRDVLKATATARPIKDVFQEGVEVLAALRSAGVDISQEEEDLGLMMNDGNLQGLSGLVEELGDRLKDV